MWACQTKRLAFSSVKQVRLNVTVSKRFYRRQHYDLIVIGTGPAGQKCAIDAAKRQMTVAIIDKPSWVGGVCTHTGTIPSKTFREAVLHLTGYQHQGFYGKSYQLAQHITVEEIMHRVKLVEGRETDIVKNQLRRNRISLYDGEASFVNAHTISVKVENDRYAYSSVSEPLNQTTDEIMLTGDKIYIATGTKPARRNDLNFDGKYIFDADQLLAHARTVPRDLIVAGAGVVGIEYASMFNIIPGSNVTVIDNRPDILSFADKEVIEALCHIMRQQGARFLMDDSISTVDIVTQPGKKNKKVVVTLESGRKVSGDALLYTVGRQGNTNRLRLDKAGITPTKRGLIEVNQHFQTCVDHIYAGGDCIGYPSLASTSMEQGRLASCHMFGETNAVFKEFFPYGIYTVPEISMVGKTEKQLSEEKIPYEVGQARYHELAKGQMLGGSFGFLKLLFCPKSKKLLGVHAIGEGATEIIHIGQVVLTMGGSIEYFRDTVFNYPTMAEAYRVAALNGLQRVDPVVDNEDGDENKSIGVDTSEVKNQKIKIA